jgi:hypothetical protein
MKLVVNVNSSENDLDPDYFTKKDRSPGLRKKSELNTSRK